MKHCPQCHREYEDDSLRFCLEDGIQLTWPDGPATAEPTMVLPAKQPGPTTISRVARPDVPSVPSPASPDTAADRIAPTQASISSTPPSTQIVRIVVATL